MMGPPCCTYWLRVPASCVLYVPEAQGSLPLGPTHCTYAVRAPASGVPCVPRTVWCITGATRPTWSPPTGARPTRPPHPTWCRWGWQWREGRRRHRRRRWWGRGRRRPRARRTTSAGAYHSQNPNPDPDPSPNPSPSPNPNPNPAQWLRCAECWRRLLPTVRRSGDLRCATVRRRYNSHSTTLTPAARSAALLSSEVSREDLTEVGGVLYPLLTQCGSSLAA